jgi:membrane protein
MIDVQAMLEWLDDFQRRHKIVSFSFAVIKRYSEDQTGHQAALLTYYAFLSLFPLLLILTTIAQLLANKNLNLQMSIVHGLTNYFPVLGGQLSVHIHSLHKNGVALFIGMAIIFYGARGVADVFKGGVRHIWHIPSSAKGSVLQEAFSSFKLIANAGIGFIVASISAGLAASAGQGLIVRGLSIVVNMIILACIFNYMIQLSLPRIIKVKEQQLAAIMAAVMITALQLFGGYVLLHVLKNLDALYSYFALSLGLISWIYLQAQAVYYAMEISVVKNNHLWPRSFTGKKLTTADKIILDKHELRNN